MFAFQGWSEESTSASAEAFPAPRCQPMLLDVITLVTKSLAQSLNHCTAATFYSVSFSKPNPVWFGKVTPKKCFWFSKPIPLWFGKKKIDTDSKPNSDWFGTIWWPLSMSWKIQTKFSLVGKSHCASLRRYLDPFFIPKFGFHLCLMSRRHLWWGKGIWEEFKISLFCFLRKFHASQLVTSWLWS